MVSKRVSVSNAHRHTSASSPPNMCDYDVILGMDFLSKYSASIKSGHRKVVSEPEGEETFVFMGESRKRPKMFLSTLQEKGVFATTFCRRKNPHVIANNDFYDDVSSQICRRK
ncbi:hypothetical protein L484_009199 [Morus notabilis]|uniref:Uncharacterized protein n=1 Tax=Morus notabilis TaxID=981085 RepID=W9SUM3_9ROSA|nr:hypothetical protein L484_009199 [Morus notabilis]